ncbi:acyltransferase family protein [Roseovarius pelagicus]|uniref:Acyltransferase n=1 Tax=Roseovarius pelagicus TaxID=2980108 RepID=A0ABY6DBB8_9RHOB|nr:acyltransferase [Roseovarius pelagicus]UXX83442.1 acyltransferase [Roseovarius pelagicus]
MNAGFSAYLNVLRFGAALVVLMSHFGFVRYSGGRWLWIREFNFGSDAVIIFFVLSGLVVAQAASRKRSGLGGFAFDRLTRLWSVAIPALVIGFTLDRIGARIAPSAYEGWFYVPLPFDEQMWRGMSFSNQWGGMATRLGTNGPYWSLSYEAAYYALFAVGFYLRGLWRVLLLAVGLWVFGLNIMLLMPAWLMGAALYFWLARGVLPRRHLALLLAVVPVLAYGAAVATGLPEALLVVTDPLDEVVNLRFSDEPIWSAILGALVAVHLMGMAGLLTDTSLSRVAPRAAWAAGASFSLYLMHYPALQFFGGIMPKSRYATLNEAMLLAAVLMFCALFARLFERPLPTLRAALLRFAMWIRPNPARAPHGSPAD